METLFTIEKLQKPNFFQRIFKISPRINAFLEINNLLATKPLKEIKSFEIEEISAKYHVDLHKEFNEQLKDLYFKYLKSNISDEIISDQEMIHLNYLRKILCLQETEIEELHDKFAGEIYTKHVNIAVSDGKLDKNENNNLDNLSKNLRLSSTSEELISSRSRQDFLQNKLDKIMSDEKISPEEWEELLLFAKDLNVNMVFDISTKERIDKLKLYWQLEHEILPVKQVSIIIQKNESCYFSSFADWFEYRTVTKRINYEGPTARIKLMKGIYYRAGSIGVERMTADELMKIDSGMLYLTNKRVIFMGGKKNFTFALNKILSITPYENFIEIEKESGKSPILNITDTIVFSLILNRLIQETHDDSKIDLNTQDMTTDKDTTIYKSSSQSVTTGSNSPIIVHGSRIITISNNNFTAELPDETLLQGSLTFHKKEDDKIVYMTDTNCPFVISKSSIFINLYRTHDAAYEFKLD